MFEAFYAWESELVFMSDIGAYLFRDGALAWSVDFYQHGVLDFDRHDYFGFTPQGLYFNLGGGETKLCRWSDGRIA